MLVMLLLVSLACVVLLLLCLPFLLLSLSLPLIAVGLSGVCFLLELAGLCTCLFFYGYQGADADAEQLALTEQLFDAASGELSVVARGQPCLLVGDFNVEPTKIPCVAKGISAGLWVDFEEAWALLLVCSLLLLVSVVGLLPVVIVGTLLQVAAAAVLSCKVQPDRWIAPHLAIQTLFDCCRWESWVTQSVQRTPLWPASWLPAVDKCRGSKSAEVQRVWEVYDERLQFMSRRDASLLDESLDSDDVSLA